VGAVTSLEWLLVVVATLIVVATLALLKLRYDDLCDEVERDAGWHRMWHERIWQDEDERRD
jgi:hypothetical protein